MFIGNHAMVPSLEALLVWVFFPPVQIQIFGKQMYEKRKKPQTPTQTK